MVERDSLLRRSATDQPHTVFVIDDDASVRRALTNLFESIGLHVEGFGSAADFVPRPDVVSCLVLDVRLPGKSGLDFQAELAEANIKISIIFITGHGDIPMTVKAMKAGAVEFLTKPFRDQEMLDAICLALERDQRRREAEKGLSDLHSRFATLTPRQLDVARWVTSGLMNKQTAARMGIAEVTVKLHRMQVMRKLRARSLVDLVQMIARVALSLPWSPSQPKNHQLRGGNPITPRKSTPSTTESESRR
jgi:FixJ family two-component response regulator